jgi:hypothetical protein
MQEHALRQALASLDPETLADYWLLGYTRPCHVPWLISTSSRYLVRIEDRYEISLVVPDELRASLPTADTAIGPLTVVVLRTKLPPDLTGFMACLATALAEQAIPIVPIGAASRDHLLVPQSRSAKALEVLKALRQQAAAALGCALLACGLAFAQEVPLLRCGDPAQFYRAEVLQGRFAEAFGLIEDAVDPHRRDIDPFVEKMARTSIDFLVEATGVPCKACQSDGVIEFKRLGEDLDLWRRAVERHRRNAPNEILDQQTDCVKQLLQRVDPAEPGELGSARLMLAFAVDREVDLPLAPLLDEDEHAAQLYAEQLLAFVSEPVEKRWRALVGTAPPDAYRTRLGPEAEQTRTRIQKLRSEVEAYRQQLEQFLERPRPTGDEQPRIDAAEQALARQFSRFGAMSGWLRFSVSLGERGQASIRLRLPTEHRVFFSAASPEGEYGLVAHRRFVQQLITRLDECEWLIDRGFSIEFGARRD